MRIALTGNAVRVELVETSAARVQLRVAILDDRQELAVWSPLLSPGESFTLAPLEVTVGWPTTES